MKKKLLLCLIPVCALTASEPELDLLPRLSIRESRVIPKEVEYKGLSAYEFSGKVLNQSNAWRSLILPRPNQGVDLEFKTGDWERPDPHQNDTVWVSYNRDWAHFNARNQSVRFRYTFGESSIGMVSIFRFGCSKNSRLAATDEKSYEIKFTFGSLFCKVDFPEAEDERELKDPIEKGTEVSVTITPEKKLSIEVNGETLLKDYEVEFEENFATFVASAEERSAPLKPRELNLRNVIVEIK